MKEQMEILVEVLDEKKEVRNVTLEAKSWDDMKAQLQEKGWELRKYRLDKSWEQKEIQPSLDFLSTLIMILGFSLITAIVFSLPFPFVRRPWIKELWGFYGLANAIGYIAIGYGIKKKILESAFVGFGIVIFDQWVTWRSFLYLIDQTSGSREWFYFLLGSVFLSGCLAMLLGLASHGIYQYLRINQRYKPNKLAGIPVSYWTKIGLCLILPCLLIWFGIQQAVLFPPKFSYAVLRLTGLATSIYLFGFTGYAFKEYVRRRKFLWLIIILISISFFVYFNGMIMTLLPVSSVIV